jgi:hypothetical protein
MKVKQSGGPISLPQKILRIAGCTLVLLILSDIAGVVVCTVFDILSSILVSFQGMALTYTVWFVLGIFTGFFIYSYSGGFAHPEISEPTAWLDHPTARKTGMLVCLVSVPLLVGVCLLVSPIGGSSGSVYVPDNTPLTITYFAAIVIAVLGSQFTLGSKKNAQAAS